MAPLRCMVRRFGRAMAPAELRSRGGSSGGSSGGRGYDDAAGATPHGPPRPVFSAPGG